MALGMDAASRGWHDDRQPPAAEGEPSARLGQGADAPRGPQVSARAGVLHFRMLGSIARYESEHRAERLRLKWDELARAGKPKGGGVRPFGFQPDRRTINEPEAALLREAAERVLAGEGMYAVLAAASSSPLPSAAWGGSTRTGSTRSGASDYDRRWRT